MYYLDLFYLINPINWLEIVSTGLFTLAGAGLGAFLAGKYAVNAMNNQLNYERNNKRMDILDNHLKINERFSILLDLTLKHINEFENNFLSNQKEKTSVDQNDLIYSIERLRNYIDTNYKELSVLPIHDLPYTNYMIYRGLLYEILTMNAICDLILNAKKIGNKEEIPKEFLEKELEDFYIKFIEQKNILEKTSKDIREQHGISKQEHDEIEEKIKKITR